MKEIIKKYSNDEITIVWQPQKCIHSRICFNGLPQVFDPTKRPWVNIEVAATDQIVSQVKKCPSGALSYIMNEANDQNDDSEKNTQIEVNPNGPLVISGTVTLKDKDSTESQINGKTAFCRCGASANKPFCDGSHIKIDFKDD